MAHSFVFLLGSFVNFALLHRSCLILSPEAGFTLGSQLSSMIYTYGTLKCCLVNDFSPKFEDSDAHGGRNSVL